MMEQMMSCVIECSIILAVGGVLLLASFGAGRAAEDISPTACMRFYHDSAKRIFSRCLALYSRRFQGLAKEDGKKDGFY